MSEIITERTGTSSSEDGDMTQEQRIGWLRERGVLIDLKSKAGTKTAAPTEDDCSGAEDMDTLVVVMVPADDAQPCEEVRIRVKRGRSGDQLLECLKW
jgi:hypothetical protein